jgi:hypothetical protein
VTRVMRTIAAHARSDRDDGGTEGLDESDDPGPHPERL